ncbi:MAG: hypothetical protein R2699_16320 [Acidimicrobiales bacterium]
MPSWRRGRRDARPTLTSTSCRPSASRRYRSPIFGDAHDDATGGTPSPGAPEHPLLGPGDYERNSARITGRTSGYGSAGPLLGADTDRVLTDLAGVSGPELEALRAAAVLR